LNFPLAVIRDLVIPAREREQLAALALLSVTRSIALLLGKQGQLLVALAGRGAMATTTTSVKPLLPVQTPTPADIDIAQACTIKHISQIAEAALGLLPEEYELYGTSKAKVCDM
jgi:ABC-type uncharacterized transport system ATPase subunit